MLLKNGILFLKLMEVVFFFTELGNVQGLLTNFKWIEDVIEDIRNDGSIFRTVLLVNQTNQEENSIVNIAQQKIVQKIPCDIVDIRGGIFTNKMYMPQYHNHRRTTLVIGLYHLRKNLDRSQELEFELLLNQVLENYEQSKCLMILSLDGCIFKFKSFLHYAWSKKFLDLTFLEHVIDKNGMNEKLYFPFVRKSNITIHYLNPFTNRLIERKYSKSMILFPDKLRNLHGYKLEVAAMNAPPNMYVKKKADGKVNKVWGFEGLTATAVANALNFIPDFKSLNVTGYGVPNCIRNRSTGYAGYILRNEIRFGYNYGPHIMCGSKMITPYSRTSGYMQFYPVVPILKKDSAYFTASTDSLKAIGVIVGLMLIVKITLYKFKFEKYYHELLNIFALSIGNGLLKSPNNDSQRIVFCFLLLGFWVFSSDIYGVLTDIQIKKDTFVKFDTLKDLYDSNLTLMMPRNSLFMLKSLESNKVYDTLLNRTKINSLQKNCLIYLMEYKNVSCIMPLETAKMYIEQFRIKYNFRGMMIGKEYFQKYGSGICFEPHSPYVKVFDRILARLTDSGLIEKWTEDYAPTVEAKHITLDDDAEEASTILLILVLFVLIVGLGSSLMLFIGELLFHRRSTLVRKF